MDDQLGDNMDVTKILADLKTERAQIEEAILTLERLADGRGKRRGRPPTWLVEARNSDPDAAAAAPPEKKRKPGRPPANKTDG